MLELPNDGVKVIDGRRLWISAVDNLEPRREVFLVVGDVTQGNSHTIFILKWSNGSVEVCPEFVYSLAVNFTFLQSWFMSAFEPVRH